MKEGIPVLLSNAQQLICDFKQSAHDEHRICYLPSVTQQSGLDEFFYREGSFNTLTLLRELRNQYPGQLYTNEIREVEIRHLDSLPKEILEKIRGLKEYPKQYVETVKKYNPPEIAELLSCNRTISETVMILLNGDLINGSCRFNVRLHNYPDHYFITNYSRIKQTPTWRLSEAMKFPLAEKGQPVKLFLHDIETLGLPILPIVNLPTIILSLIG